MRWRVLHALVIGLLLITAGCATSPGPQTTATPTTTISTTPEPASPSTESTTASGDSTPPTTTTVGYNEPTPHDLRLKNTYSTPESVELRIRNESGDTVVHRNFTLQSDSAILVEDLNYSGPRGAEYTITVVHDEDTETIQAHEPWTKLIYVKLSSEGASIKMVAV